MKRDRAGHAEEREVAVPGSDGALPGADPVVTALARAESGYAAVRTQAARDRAALQDARDELEQLRQAYEGVCRERDQMRAVAERVQRDRQSVATHVKAIHSSLFEGTTHQLVLRTCLSLTGASRGLYVVATDDGVLRVRAMIGMDVDRRAPLPPFLAALCRRAHDAHDVVVWNGGALPDGVPAPEAPGEQLRNVAIAPVVLLRGLDGILVAADKDDGDFDERDVEMLLHVGDQASVAVDNTRLRRELEAAYLSAVTMLADAAEAKDPYTHGHCETVSRLCRRIAQGLGLGSYDVRVACYAGLLHDIGKIAVSDGILNKPGPLLPEEQSLVRSHVRVGHDLLTSIPALAAVAQVVLHHHERWDGQGYPEGLAEHQIPIASRIVAVADSYCAMTDHRTYKKAMTPLEARDEVVRCSGSQFDPRIVEAFVSLFDAEGLRDGDGDFDAECGLPPLLHHADKPAS